MGRPRALSLLIPAILAVAAAWPGPVRAQAECTLWQTWFFDGFDSLSAAWSRDARAV